MATSDVDITEGSGLKVASHTISEDAVTKHIQRVNINHSDGTALTDGTGLLISTSQLDPTVAHDAADSGAPYKQGFKATTSISAKTMVANDDRTDGFAGIDGVQIIRTHCNLEDIVSGTASNTDGTSTEVIAAAGANIKQYLTRVSLSNTSSSAVMVALKSGSTTRWRVLVPGPSGREFDFDPPLKPNAANEAWNFDPDSATTTVECSMNGFKSKV
jgi:hypothetical protein